MSTDGSDSEDFVSADEYVSDESDLCKTHANKVLQSRILSDQQSEEESDNDVRQETVDLDKNIVVTEVKSYRKRPERTRKTPPPVAKPPAKPIVKNLDLKPLIDIVKVARPEVLVSNITSLTSNITKGFAKLQQDTLIKELVVGCETKEVTAFEYDDNRVSQTNTPPKANEKVSTKELTQETENSYQEPIIKSTITDEILKLSEAFEKLNKTRLAEETVKDVMVLEEDKCENQEQLNERVHEGNSSNVDSPPIDDEGEAGWDHCDNSFIEEHDKTINISRAHEQWNPTEKATEVDKTPKEEVEHTNSEGSFQALKAEHAENKNISHLETNQQVNEQLNPAEKATDDDYGPEPGTEHAQTYQKEPSDRKEKEDIFMDRPCSDSKNLETANISQNLNELENVIDEGWDDWGNDFDDEIKTESTEKLENIDVTAIKSHEGSKEDEAEGWGDWEGFDNESTEHTTETTPVKKIEHDNDGWGNWSDEDVEDKSNPTKTTQLEQPFSTMKDNSEPEWGGWSSFGEKKEWGGGWGINSLLSTASAVTSNLSVVTQGLSSVIESGIGVPDPVTMAKIQVEEQKTIKEEGKTGNEEEDDAVLQFPFRDIVSGVGKIVQVAKVQQIGSRVLSGGLDTLETIGKKTMQVLQEGDPGLKKKRALLMGKGQMLSEVLRDARDRSIAEEKLNAVRMCHFETLFDDYHGLVHLEALEMLSCQCQLRLEQIQQTLPAAKLQELRDTMEEVGLLCELDDDFDDNVDSADFKGVLSEAAKPLSDQLSIDKILEVHDRIVDWLTADMTSSSAEIYDYMIRVTAELTSAVTLQYHKSGELLLLKERRKTVQEADSLLQLSTTICSELLTIASKVAAKIKDTNEPDVELLTTNLQVEIENAVGFIKQAFTLLVPVLQLGAT